jgi:hypothetical protein
MAPLEGLDWWLLGTTKTSFPQEPRASKRVGMPSEDEYREAV